MSDVRDGAWPFSGRETERAAVVAAARSGGGVYLSAPAGAGKSRLLREALATLADEGESTGLIIATRGAQAISSSAIVHLLPGLSPQDHPDALSWYRAVAAQIHPPGSAPPI